MGGQMGVWVCGLEAGEAAWRRRGAAAHLERAERRAPLGELAVPVGEGRLRDDDQVGARHAAALLQVAEQRDRLQRLAEAHLVGEDGVDAAAVHGREPAQPAQHLEDDDATIAVRRGHEQLVGRAALGLEARARSPIGKRCLRQKRRPRAPLRCSLVVEDVVRHPFGGITFSDADEDLVPVPARRPRRRDPIEPVRAAHPRARARANRRVRVLEPRLVPVPRLAVSRAPRVRDVRRRLASVARLPPIGDFVERRAPG